MYQECAKAGLLVPIAAGKSIPPEWAKYPIIAGIKAEEWDGFHDFVLWDELVRRRDRKLVYRIGRLMFSPFVKE